jgi:hypothetical protein
MALAVDEHGAIGVTVEGNSKIGPARSDLFLESFKMESSGIEVDVSAVGLTVKSFHASSQIAQEVWSYARERAVRAVYNQPHPLEIEIPGKALAKMPGVKLAFRRDRVHKE